MKNTVLIGAGGTGGHVIPAVSIAKQLIKDGFSPIIVGSGNILEKVTESGIESVIIATASPSINPIKAIKFFWKLRKGISQSKLLIKNTQPVAVIGMGGYPSAPLILAARKKYPIFLHEQNSVAGRANRFLSKYTDVVMTAFKGTTGLPEKKIEVVGNPLRWSEIPLHSKEVYETFGLNSTKKTILYFGGSQGAQLLNEAFLSLSEEFVQRDDLQWIFITGKKMFQETKNTVEEKGFENVRIFEYLAEMEQAYSVADLVISRSGAMTVSELECLGTPSILVPKSNSIFNHQLKNALYLKSKHKNIVILDETKLNQTLQQTIETSLKKDKINPEACMHINSAQTISEIIQATVRSE